MADLTASLRYLYLFFNARHRYPVGAPIWGSNLDEQRIATPATHASGPRHGTVVFHDYLTASHVAALHEEVRRAVRRVGEPPLEEHRDGGESAGDGGHGGEGGDDGDGGSGSDGGADEKSGGGSSEGGEGSGSGRGLRFVVIDNSTFSLPPALAHLRARVPRSIRGYGMGYRHMCRFFCASVFGAPIWLEPGASRPIG